MAWGGASAGGAGRWAQVASRGGGRGAASRVGRGCSARCRGKSVMTMQATAWKSSRSSAEICSAGRTKMPPGRSMTLAPLPGGDQADDLVLEALAVAGVVFVPDHQIHRQPP